MKSKLPTSVAQLFWGDNLDQLNWGDHHQYMTQTILEKGDTAAVQWLFGQTSPESIRDTLSTYQLSPKSSNFWQIYLS